MSKWLRWAAFCITVAAAWIAWHSGSAAVEKTAQNRLFEMRTYITHEGKLDDLHKRFREHTNKLFEKHGMTLIGYWTPVDGPQAKNTLVYILAYPDRDAREKSWKEFSDD